MPSPTPAPDDRRLLQENRERSAANRAALARRQSDTRAITSAVNRQTSTNTTTNQYDRS